jgi:hypothetical protein
MNMAFSLFRRKTESGKAVRPSINSVHLTRTFVETGDERCPIAGIWSRLTDRNSLADDAEIAMPAMRLLLWRAFHPLLTTFRYSIA